MGFLHTQIDREIEQVRALGIEVTREQIDSVPGEATPVIQSCATPGMGAGIAPC